VDKFVKFLTGYGVSGATSRRKNTYGSATIVWEGAFIANSTGFAGLFVC